MELKEVLSLVQAGFNKDEISAFSQKKEQRPQLLDEQLLLAKAGYTKEEISAMYADKVKDGTPANTESKEKIVGKETSPEKRSTESYLMDIIKNLQEENRILASGNGTGTKEANTDDILAGILRGVE